MEVTVEEYYSKSFTEEDRHNDSFGTIQELRTKEVILQYLKEGMSILDVGGANGVYSFYFADKGYDTSIVDITPRHIERVVELNNDRVKKLKGIHIGDAINMDLGRKYDLVILHGPLYHIVKKEDRLIMLKNIKRHLNKGGIVLGFAINRYAGYFYGVRSGAILNEEYRNSVLNEIKSGFRGLGPGWYFHKAKELEDEFLEAGYNVESVKSLVGQTWMLPEIENLIKAKDGLKLLLNLSRSMEDEVNIGQDLVCISRIE